MFHRTLASFPVLTVTAFLIGPSLAHAQDKPSPPQFVARDVEPALLNGREIQTLLADNYPPRLRRDGISSSVTLYLFIDVTGNVMKVEIYEKSVYAQFNKAARTVANAMRFRPAENDGEPVGVWVLQRLDFNTR